MSVNELAIKFSTAPASERLGILSRDEVLGEVYQEHEFELDAMQQQLDEANGESQEHEDIADDFATAIKLALTKEVTDEVRQILGAVIDENPGYGRNPA